MQYSEVPAVLLFVATGGAGHAITEDALLQYPPSEVRSSGSTLASLPVLGIDSVKSGVIIELFPSPRREEACSPPGFGFQEQS